MENLKRSHKYKVDGFDVLKVTTVEERWTPKVQVEIGDAIEQRKQELRQKINQAKAGLGKLENEELAFVEQSKRDLKRLNLEQSKKICLKKFKALLESKKAVLLRQSFDKTAKVDDYLDDMELYARVIYTGFQKEVMEDSEIREVVPGSVINEFQLKGDEKCLVKRKDVYDFTLGLIGGSVNEG